MSSANRDSERQSWLAKVAEVAPVLIEHAEASDQMGTLATPVVDALRAGGFLSLKIPRQLGGAEAGPLLQMDVYEAISYIHPSSGWCTMVAGGSSLGPTTRLPDAGIEILFPNGHIPTFAGTFFPAGSAKLVDGGFRVSGRWRFASGVRHAEWVHCGAVVDDGSQPKDLSSSEVIQVVVPTDHIRIVDNWHVLGLKGTGSCDFEITDVFVPQHLTHPHRLETAQLYRGGPLYKLNVPTSVACEHIGFAAGVARRALDELINMATTTRGKNRPSSLAERQVVHRMIGEFDLKLRAAKALANDYYENIWQRLLEGQTIGPDLHVQSRALSTFITELAVDITQQAFRYGGAGALFQPNILELLMRDMNAAAQHIMASDAAYEEFGKSLLGLEYRPV